MRSRWGGFGNGRKLFRNFFKVFQNEEYKNMEIEAPKKPADFNYTTSQGIWNLDATTLFRGDLPSTGLPLLVGYATASSANGGAVTINLNNLQVPTDSLSFSNGNVQEGDLIVFAYGAGTQYVSSMNVATSGYTEVFSSNLTGNDTYDCVGNIAYKVATAADTSVSSTSVTGRNTFYAASVGAVMVFRISNGNGTFNIFNSRSSTRSNSAIPPVPSIPSTTGNIAIAFGVSAHVYGTISMSSASFDRFISKGQNDTRDGTIGLGYKFLTPGQSFSPSMSITSNSNSSAVAGIFELTII